MRPNSPDAGAARAASRRLRALRHRLRDRLRLRNRVRLRTRVRARLRAARRDPATALVRATTVAVLLVSSAFMLLPLYWLFSVAVRPTDGLSVPPAVVPSSLTAEHLAAALLETQFPLWVANSVAVSAATVALAVAVATPAGYALSRFDLRYERALIAAVLGVQMIPLLALVTPLYRLFAVVGLLDTLTVLVLANTVLVVPVGIWLIKGYFDTLPRELEEAARVGGATRLQAFRVVVPLARPAVAATAIFAFVASWNQFLLPLSLTSSEVVYTVPVGIYEFVGRRAQVQWPLLGAACLWAMVPVLVVVVAFDRHLVAGLSGGVGGDRSG